MSGSTDMPVQCPTHGEAEARFVCAHMAAVIQGDPAIPDAVFSDDGVEAYCRDSEIVLHNLDAEFDKLVDGSFDALSEEDAVAIMETDEGKRLLSQHPLRLVCSFCFDRLLTSKEGHDA